MIHALLLTLALAAPDANLKRARDRFEFGAWADAAGSVLAIDPGDVSRVDAAGVTASVAADGQSIDVSVPQNPERQSFSFTYKINNGKSPQKDEGRVTVTLVGDEVNSPPVLRPGTANLSRKVYPVNPGKLLPVQVVGDWRDPESDPLTLQASSAGSSVDGLGRLNVLAPMKPGTQGVEYAVGDGRDSSKGTVSVKVLDADDTLVKPQTQPDVVRGVVGKPLQLEPLGNDIPGADPTEPDARLRLSRELQSPSALAVDTNLGWKGASEYVATVPQVFDLLADPQERYDIFMTTFTESTWAVVPANESVEKLMKTYVEYPPRKLQSETYTGPITISKYQLFKSLQEQLAKDGFSIGLPTGN